VTRRLVLAILGTTIAALVLAGLGTLAIASWRAKDAAEEELRGDVAALAEGLVTETRSGADRPAITRAMLTALRRVLKAEDVVVVQLDASGRPLDALPAGVLADDLDAARLAAGEVVSGQRGRLVYAAAPAELAPRAAGALRSRAYAVVAAQRITADQRTVRFFAFASAVVIALGAVVAVTLGRRLTKPVRDADAAARRIAAGELSTRLPDPPAGATDELADLVRSVNTMAETLERSKKLEQSFLLSVSHDLRTPLTSIRGYAEAITDGATRDPQWAAGVILAESRRLERLVRDLLDLAKLQARSFSLEPSRRDLSALAVQAVEGVAPDAAAAGVRLGAHCPEPVPAHVDPDRMQQVLANLVENAMKYANGSVQVGTAAAGGTAMVWVDDDGPGIAPEDRPFVFERLYVSRREPRRAEIGSGLGLAIVHELVTAMDGTVAAESAPGGGARMVVRLPLAA
jgi:two-component system sensor histidine kinase BaeS